MNPDLEFRLKERSILLNDELPLREQIQVIHRRNNVAETVFSLMKPVTIEEYRIPRFSLDRGDAVLIPLGSGYFFNKFLPLVAGDSLLVNGTSISLRQQARYGLFKGHIQWDKWMSVQFDISRQSARKKLRKRNLGKKAGRTFSELLAIQMLFIEMASEAKIDTISPSFLGLDPISAEKLTDFIKQRLNQHAWIFNFGAAHIANRCLLPE